MKRSKKKKLKKIKISKKKGGTSCCPCFFGKKEKDSANASLLQNNNPEAVIEPKDNHKNASILEDYLKIINIRGYKNFINMIDANYNELKQRILKNQVPGYLDVQDDHKKKLNILSLFTGNGFLECYLIIKLFMDGFEFDNLITVDQDYDHNGSNLTFFNYLTEKNIINDIIYISSFPNLEKYFIENKKIHDIEFILNFNWQFANTINNEISVKKRILKFYMNDIEGVSAILKIISMIMDFNLRKDHKKISNRRNKIKYDVPVFFIGTPIKTFNKNFGGFETPKDGILSISDFKLKMDVLLNRYYSKARENLGLEVAKIETNKGTKYLKQDNDTYEILKSINKSFDDF